MGANSSIYIVSVCQEKCDNCAIFFVFTRALLSFGTTFFPSNRSLAERTSILAWSFFFLFVFVSRVKSKNYINCEVQNMLFTLMHTFESHFRLTWTFMLMYTKQYCLEWQPVLPNMHTACFWCSEKHTVWREREKMTIAVEMTWTSIAIELAKALKQSMKIVLGVDFECI